MPIAPIKGPNSMSPFGNVGLSSDLPRLGSQACGDFSAGLADEVEASGGDFAFEMAVEAEHPDAERQPRQKSPHSRQPLKKSVLVRIDLDVLARLRARGEGWQSLINAVLRQWCGLSQAPGPTPNGDPASPLDVREQDRPRKRVVRLSDDQRKTIAREFRSGLSAANLAGRYGISLSAVYYASRFY